MSTDSPPIDDEEPTRLERPLDDSSESEEPPPPPEDDENPPPPPEDDDPPPPPADDSLMDSDTEDTSAPESSSQSASFAELPPFPVPATTSTASAQSLPPPIVSPLAPASPSSVAALPTARRRSTTVYPDSAWGRAGFSEAEIKKAFELDAESERQQESAALAGGSKKKPGDKKPPPKKEKDKKAQRKSKFNGDEKLEALHEQEWEELMRDSTEDSLATVTALDLTDDQAKSDSFDQLARFSANNPYSQVANKVGRSFISLHPKITARLFSLLTWRELSYASLTCKSWREQTLNEKDIWRSLFKHYEGKLFTGQEDKNIWDEIGTDFKPDAKSKEVKEASLNTLVAKITPQGDLPDMMDVSTFVITYQTFTTIDVVIRKLLQRYLVPEKPGPEAKNYLLTVVRPIQLRVGKLLRQLLELNSNELAAKSDLVDYMRCFIRGYVDQVQLAKLLSGGILALKKKSELLAAANMAALQADKGKSGATLKTIFDLSTDEIARQLTLVEFEIYSSIKPAEFFGQAWAKEKTWHRAPHIRKLIDRFNSITKWIVTEIVNEDKIRNRIKKVIKFIKIGEALKKFNNFHTLMAILGGLDDMPVHRLKHTYAELPQKAKDILAGLTAVMSADGSYAKYRAELAAATPPCIPYIGIYLRDLTYFEEGGSSAGEGLINFKKKKNVYGVLQIIQKYQQLPYSFKPNERAYNFMTHLPGLDADAAFKASLAIEPRNAKRADIT